MSSQWLKLLFETCELGVSSAVAPELLPPNQVAWAMNTNTRGGKPGTRPNMALRAQLIPGLFQGAEYFSVQGGMIVCSIGGRLFRIRINASSVTAEEIPLTFPNSGIINQVWMTQTVETLVIQDGQSNAILYNGSVAVRSVPPKVPRGRQMAFLNGRLWVAVNANEIVAGDIRTGVAGSELYFTEATYLLGGGKLFFPSDITAMAGIPVTGVSDYGALLIFAAQETNAVRADITARDDWGKVPGFVTSILRSVGAASQWSLVSVNQDLYWRDSNGGIRSIRNALADEAGPGSSPISREVSRLTDFDSQQLLPWCSGIYFENRLLMTSSPFLLPHGAYGWKDLISLDFAPLSTMGGKSQPAYNGQWNGLIFSKLVSGKFNGKNRAFAFTTDAEGFNQIWEFNTGDRDDLQIDCTDGTATIATEPHPITCFIEYPRRDFGESRHRKRLERCDLWLSQVDGEIEIKVQWRADNAQKWLDWDDATTCAQTTDPATTEPHVWKNLLPQERPQFKTFTIPQTINEVTKYAAECGFEFQMRLVWTGKLRVHRMMIYASLLDDPDFADRAGFSASCEENDVSGNTVEYQIRSNCDNCLLTFIVQPAAVSVGTGGDVNFFVEISSLASEMTFQWQVSDDDGDTWVNLENSENASGVDTVSLSLTDIPEDWNGNLYRCVVILLECAAGGLPFYSDSAPLTVAAQASVLPDCDTEVGYDYNIPEFSRSWPLTDLIQFATQQINTDGSFEFSGTFDTSGRLNAACQLFFYKSASSVVMGSDALCFSDGISGAAAYDGPITGSGQIDCLTNPDFDKPFIWAYYSASCQSPPDPPVVEESQVLLGQIFRTPFVGNDCYSAYVAVWGCCVLSRDSRVRGQCLNLIVGRQYTVTFTFTSSLGGTDTVPIEITAASENQFTSYVNIPAECDETWTLQGVTIELIPVDCPEINEQPPSRTVPEDFPVIFFVSASEGSLGNEYQWQMNDGGGWDNLSDGGNFSGVTTNVLTVASAGTAMDGYEFRCVISSLGCDDLISDEATLTVDVSGCPIIVTEPSDASVLDGAQSAFAADVISSGVITYQWQRSTGGPFVDVVDGGIFSGANDSVLFIDPTPLSMNGDQFRCILISNACPVQTRDCLLTVT